MKNITSYLKTTEFVVERCETTVVRRQRHFVDETCEDCGNDSPMMRPEEASVYLGINIREIYVAIEAGTAHFTEECGLKVCVRSLTSGVESE